MKWLWCLAFATSWISTSITTEAQAAPKYRLNAEGTEVVALSGLTDGAGCLASKEDGTISELTRGPPRQALTGFWLKTRRGREFINVDVEAAGLGPDAKAWIAKGIDRMIKVGAGVRVSLFACGAAGRIVSLDAISLVGDGVAAPAKGGWRRAMTRPSRVEIQIVSQQSNVSLYLGCSRTPRGSLYHQILLAQNREWTVSGDKFGLGVDGRSWPVELDGADELSALSDSVVDKHAAVSEPLLASLGSGSTLTIPGRKRRVDQTISFDLGSGRAELARYVEECRVLPR